ncbi:probable receptor-like protein kinase At2g42960 isoform X2 [Musa acuminata AAA Group]|uniref:probable receptor-like protein kinase At2g42960 isoform X2 n=1 Tax=Musa acuminata AAA Group TaxID=214697 RepID=UPI0031DF90DB
MSSGSSLNAELLQKTPVFGLRLWVVIGICFGVLIVFILTILSTWVTFKRKTSRGFDNMTISQIPTVSKEITVDRVGNPCDAQTLQELTGPFFHSHDKFSDTESVRTLAHLTMSKSSDADNLSHCSSAYHNDRAGSSYSGDEGSTGPTRKTHPAYAFVAASPLIGLPESSQLGWGHWFTLRDLELATNRFSKENVIGEGGYGIVYRGRLINGSEVAVKKLLNNLGQAEKEFRVEVEAIGHVRHKNLVRLLGYCVEGIHRMLVYEYVNNGNLEQWLHGAMRQHGILSWENRMKVILGTAKAYVAPEYANTGLLNEKSDVYSFGVLLLETVTGRDPVDYGRPTNEVNLVEWLKMMVGNRRAEEVVDPNLEVKPAMRALKRTLLVALRCVDPDSDKRPKMGQVVRMLEADELPYREDRRNRRNQAGSMEIEALKESNSSTDLENKVGLGDNRASDRFQA